MIIKSPLNVRISLEDLKKAKWIKSTGEIVPVVPADGSKFTLLELQRFVGGHIEIVRPPSIDGSAALVVNEEGKIMDLPVNGIATATYGIPDIDVIHGDVLLCRWEQLD